MTTTPKTRYLRDGDVHIAWQCVGDGDIDLLVAPGYISHLDLNWTLPAYADFMTDLARFSRVILFDKRGTGLSDPDPDAARFERRMADIDLVLNAADSERAVIFGLSEGGPLASLYAATHPDRVESLILCGTFARGDIIDASMLQRFDRAVDNWGDGETAGIFLTDSDGPVARRFIGLFERAAASPGVARRLLTSIQQCDVRSALPALRAPTLILHREGDPFALRQWSDELEALIPGAERLELPGRDHLPWMGDSGPVVAAIEEWVTGRPAARPSSSRFATVLFTDIIDSTRRLAELGDASWTRMIQRHNDICREMFENSGGWAIKSTGDGFMVCFDTPEPAVQCAFNLHRAVGNLDLQIRAGLHCGEVERMDFHDVTGMTVNLASRVAEMALPGQTLVTAVLDDLLVGSDVTSNPVGRHHLKGVPWDVEVVELLPDLTVIDLTEPSHRQPDRAVDSLTLNLARRAPGLMRGLAKLTGAQ